MSGLVYRSLMGKDLLSLLDYGPEQLPFLVKRAIDYKHGKIQLKPLSGKTVALIFEKPSTRTRTSVSVAINELGGFPLLLPTAGLQVSRGETLRDTAQVLSRYVQAIAARVKSHSTLDELAKWASVPIVNMLSDLFHPLQAIADTMTMIEHFGERKMDVVFLGDGGANTSHSLMLASALLGNHHVISSPPEYGPDLRVLDKAMELARSCGGEIEMVEDPREAVKGADVIYTDTWVSMGAKDVGKRLAAFPPHQISEGLLSKAPSHAVVLHCQPWYIGQEITEEVAYGPRSLAFEQAENRLHTAKSAFDAILHSK